MTAAAPHAGHLTHLGILRFTGPDAANFLQGQLTNDLKLLKPGSVMLAAYLNPQGRVLAVLRVLPHSSGVLAILPRELKTAVAERMRKYVMRAKVKIDDPGESLQVLGYHRAGALVAAGLPVPGEGEGYLEQDGIGVARAGDGLRYWVIAPPGSTPAVDAGAGDSAERAWRWADIQTGQPQVYGVTSEAFVAQMLNLDLLDGISFSKGCYTGQEIVARTQHLGRIKRRLFHLRLPAGGRRVGDEIVLQDGRQGRITEAIDGDDASDVLAVLSLEGPAAGETPPGAAIDAIPVALPYNL